MAVEKLCSVQDHKRRTDSDSEELLLTGEVEKKRAVASKSFVVVSRLSILIEWAKERRGGHVCTFTDTTGHLKFVGTHSAQTPVVT